MNGEAWAPVELLACGKEQAGWRPEKGPLRHGGEGRPALAESKGITAFHSNYFIIDWCHLSFFLSWIINFTFTQLESTTFWTQQESISFLLRKLRCYFIKHYKCIVLIVYIRFGEGVGQRACSFPTISLWSQQSSSSILLIGKQKKTHPICTVCWTPRHVSGPPDLALLWLRRTQEQWAKENKSKKHSDFFTSCHSHSYVQRNLYHSHFCSRHFGNNDKVPKKWANSWPRSKMYSFNKYILNTYSLPEAHQETTQTLTHPP